MQSSLFKMESGKIYVPFQPGWERTPSYVTTQISSQNPLYGIVFCYYQFNLKADSSSILHTLPDASVDVIFQYSGYRISAYAAGSYKSMVSSTFKNCDFIFGIRFHPGKLGNLFQCSAASLSEAHYDINDFLKGNHILTALMDANTFEARISILEPFLIKRLNNYLVPLVIEESLKQMMETDGNITIEILADKLGYTSRYLRKIFTEFVGVSPKLFCQIIRFQKSFYYYTRQDGIPLCSLAMDYGYYDQSHMNREYVKLTNESPKSLKYKLISGG
jgi:AraC-like DNA-binding protein